MTSQITVMPTFQFPRTRVLTFRGWGSTFHWWLQLSLSTYTRKHLIIENPTRFTWANMTKVFTGMFSTRQLLTTDLQTKVISTGFFTTLLTTRMYLASKLFLTNLFTNRFLRIIHIKSMTRHWDSRTFAPAVNLNFNITGFTLSLMTGLFTIMFVTNQRFWTWHSAGRYGVEAGAPDCRLDHRELVLPTGTFLD